MAAQGITILKNNVPWGPFTRAQIDEGLLRGDFTVKSLAHAPGLGQWLPLGEVLDYVALNMAPPLPPVPAPRELPPVPQSSAAIAEQPAPPPPLPPVIQKSELKPDTKPEAPLVSASFILRGIAFLIDCAILFMPVAILFILCALAIEIPAAWRPIPHQARMDEWDQLDSNIRRLAWLVAIGFGWLYGAGYECSPSQATVGKRWMGIKVVSAQGQRINFLHATGRYAAKYLSALPCFLGFIAALFSSRGLALHDRLSQTRVVKR